MTVRHVVVGMILAAACGVARPAQAQEEWRVRFAAGEEAREAGEHGTYASEMAAAARAMPEGHLNRPFVQYHAARAAALQGDAAEAAHWLGVAWDEGIESLMISFAAFDPAFEPLADDPGLRSVMGRASEMELETRALAPGVWLVDGAGSNVVVKVGDEGVLMVDTGYGPALPAVERAVSELGGGPIRTLIITHPHEDHMGAAADIGMEAQVLAHPGTTAAMREPYVFMEGVTMPPKAASAHPDREITEPTEIVFGGETIRLVPTVAHTAGDVSVYFTESHVAHLGDTFLAGNPMMYPGAEDPDAFLDRLESFLDSMDPSTVVVGGHEAVTDLDAVRAQIGVSRDAMAFVRASIEEGRSIEETARAGQDRFPPQWVAFFYQFFTQAGG